MALIRIGDFLGPIEALQNGLEKGTAGCELEQVQYAVKQTRQPRSIDASLRRMAAANLAE